MRGQRHSSAAHYPPGKTRYPLYRSLGGPQGRFGQVQKISPPPGFDPRTIQPVASCYTDYATRPTLTGCNDGIFGVLDHRIADCRSFDVSRVLRKQTAEHKISLNKVRNLGFIVCGVFAQSALTCYRDVTEDPNVDDKISSKLFECGNGLVALSTSCTVSEGVAVLIRVGWSWRMTGEQLWSRYRRCVPQCMHMRGGSGDEEEE